MSIRRLATRC